jgi:hypothetical protein
MSEIQYPVTPYRFDIETAFGDLRLDIEPTEFDDYAPFSTKTYGGNTAPEAEFKAYLRDFGFGMRGHRVDLSTGQASPSDIYHVLLMSRGYREAGKQNSIIDFDVTGFIPPVGYADLPGDDPEGTDEEDSLMESADGEEKFRRHSPLGYSKSESYKNWSYE